MAELYPVQNDFPDPFKIPPAERIPTPGALTLYRDSTGFEKALADTEAERLMDTYAEAIIDQWNPWQVAYEHLPFLAWAQGVNLWERYWDETFRRNWVARQWYLKSIRGTRAGLDEFVAAVGGHVKRCVVPPARAYGTKAMTDEERAAYVARFPQLRVYPYVAREQLPWLCYCGVHYDNTGQNRRYNKNGSFLGPRRPLYPTVQNAGGKYTRTATLYEPRTGVETKLTVRRIVKINTGPTSAWGFTPGVSQYDESVILPLEHRPNYFIGEDGKYLISRGDLGIFLGKQLPLRTVSISRSGFLDLVQGKAQYQTIFPDEELLQIRPEYVAIKHLRRKTELYAARGEYLLLHRAPVCHLGVPGNALTVGSPEFGRAVFKEFSANSLAVHSPVLGAPVIQHRIANYDVDTSAWIMMTEAIGGEVSTPRRVLMDAFIVGLKADGVWPLFDRLWIFASEDIFGAIVDLKRRRLATVNGSPYFTNNRGFVTIGAAGYVGLDYRFVVNGETYTQNSAHISCWNLTDGQSVYPTLIGNGAGGHADIYAKYTDNTAISHINDNPDTNGFAIGDCRGLLLGNRSGATARQFYFNGVSLGAYPSNNSQFPSDLELTVYTREIAAVSVGGSMSAAQQLAFYNRIRTYMLGVPIVAGAPVSGLLATSKAVGSPIIGIPALTTAAGTGDADVAAWEAGVVSAGGTVSATRKGHVVTLVEGLKADGIWAKLDRFWLLAAENNQSARVDLKTRTVATTVGAPTFNPNSGYVCSPSAYLNLQYNFSTNAVNLNASSAHAFTWNLLNGTSNQASVTDDPGVNFQIYSKYSDGNIYARIFDSSGGFPISDPRGLLLANRSSSVDRQLYQNNTVIGSTAGYTGQASQGTANRGLLFFDGQSAACGVGGSLNATEQLAFYNRLRAYMTAVGVP